MIRPRRAMIDPNATVRSRAGCARVERRAGQQLQRRRAATMASVDIGKVDKFFGSTQVLYEVEIEIGDGEFVVLVGPSGCGKSTLLADDRGAGGDQQRRDRDRRPGGQQRAAQGPRHRHGVPELRALPAHDGVRQHGVLAEAGEGAQGRDPAAGPAGGADPRAAGLPRALSAPALGRPAPARRHGPRDRARPRGVPVRRAALQSRRQAAGADAHRDQGAASAPQDHLGLRHPRPDRGDDHGGPDRRDARRRGRAGRRAARSLRPAGQSVRRRVHRLAGDELHRRHDQAQRRRRARSPRTAPSCRCRRTSAAGTARRSCTASGRSTWI